MSAAWVGRVVGQAIDWSLLRVFAAVGEMAERTQPPRYRDEADALNAAEESRDSWEPDELWAAAQVGPESPKWVKDAIDAANQYAAETYLHFIPQRSAAVSSPAADNTPEHLEAAYNYHRPQANYNGTLVWGCEGCNWHGATIQAHSRHRFHVLADMKNATHRIQEQLGGAS